MRLAHRMRGVQPSATLAITAQAKAMKARGINVIGFGAGEPDFDTPLHVKEAAIKATMEGFTKYTPVGGIDELKDAIIDRAREDLGVLYERSQVIVSCGAKHAVYNAAMALFQEGDEVLLPSPYWVSYPEILTVVGATPVVVPTEEKNGFKIMAELLDGFITPRSRAIILNSPCNPTGSVYTQEELDRLAEVILKRDLIVISDDIYDKLVYGGTRPGHILKSDPELVSRTVVINGVSKTYAMTGWRIGYAMGPKEVISAMDIVQGQSTSNPTSVAQKAAVAALRGPQDFVEEMVSEFDRRRLLMWTKLNSMEGLYCHEPKGAFYMFPNIKEFLGRTLNGRVLQSPSDLASYLLEEARVAVVPGEPFGSDEHLRLSFALSMEEIIEGLERIEKALRALK